MTSNGPASCRRSLYSLVRAIAAAATSSGVRSTCTVRNPSRPSPRSAAAELAALAAEHVRAEVPVRAAGVALGAELLRQVEHDRDRQHVVLAGQHDQLAAGFGLHVGGVDDGQPAGCQPLAGDELQHLERGRRGGLVVLVVGDQAAAEVRGDHLGRLEVRPGERRLARAGHADQHDQAQLGDAQVHGSASFGRRPPAGWAGRPAGPRGRPAGTWPGSRSGRRPGRPRRGTRALVHSKRWSGCRIAPAASVGEVRVVLGVGGGDDDGAGRAPRRTRPAPARGAGPGPGAR